MFRNVCRGSKEGGLCPVDSETQRKFFSQPKGPSQKYGTSIHLKRIYTLKTNCIIIIMRIHLFGVKCKNTNLLTEKAPLYLLLMLILKFKDSYHSIESRAANSAIVLNAAPAMIFTSSPETCTNHLKLFLSDQVVCVRK